MNRPFFFTHEEIGRLLTLSAPSNGEFRQGIRSHGRDKIYTPLREIAAEYPQAEKIFNLNRNKIYTEFKQYRENLAFNLKIPIPESFEKYVFSQSELLFLLTMPSLTVPHFTILFGQRALNHLRFICYLKILRINKLFDLYHDLKPLSTSRRLCQHKLWIESEYTSYYNFYTAEPSSGSVLYKIMFEAFQEQEFLLLQDLLELELHDSKQYPMFRQLMFLYFPTSYPEHLVEHFIKVD